MSWIVEEARKQDPNKQCVVLENPETVREIEDALLGDLYPFVRTELENSGYLYSPSPIELKLDTEVEIDDNPARSFIFMLFDDLSYSFFKGKLKLSKRGYMFERRISLGLPKETDPSFMFRILSDENFAGFPPSLHIEGESEIFPEWNTYYYIEFHSGSGIDSGGWTLHNTAKGNIKEAIENSIEMYEHSMIDGFSTLADVEEFLKIAYRTYEGY